MATMMAVSSPPLLQETVAVCAAKAEWRNSATTVIPINGESSKIPSSTDPSPTAFAPNRFQSTHATSIPVAIMTPLYPWVAGGQSCPSERTKSVGYDAKSKALDISDSQDS